MIYALYASLKSRLESFGCPVQIFYGQQRATTRALTTRIVVQRAYGETETIEAPRGRPVNPPLICSQNVRGRVLVYAASTAPGATQHEHERLADVIKRTVLVLLYKQVQEDRQFLSLEAGRFLTADELELAGLQDWPGLVYQIDFTVNEGAFDMASWADAIGDAAGLDEATLGVDFTMPVPTPTTEIE